MENAWEADAFLAAFHEAVDSKTESEFKTHRADLKEHSEYLASYLDINWWKYKERIVRAWADRYPHFGVRDTSLVEGTHAKCKGWIRSSRGDLYTVFKSLLPWWEGAAADTRLISARNAVITPALLQPSYVAAVVRVITVYALTETQKLWKDACKVVYSRLQRDTCSGTFRFVHGRPCLHDLATIIESNGRMRLLPQHFAKHWWINRHVGESELSRVLDPAPMGAPPRRSKRKASHRVNAGINGTRRDPIFSERVDQNHPARPPSSTHRAKTDSEVVVLPPVQAVVPPNESMPAYEENYCPPRSWGYAGWSV